MGCPTSDHSSSLNIILNNSVVLRQLLPYLPVQAVLALSSTSKTNRDALNHEPDVFRYLDLSGLKKIIPCNPQIDKGGMNWRQERMDEALIEDEFVSGPLRGVFSRLQKRGSLFNVQTMILDGLGVTAELVHEILSEDQFNVKVLSIRDCATMNNRKLMQVIQTAVRPSRPLSMVRLKALYVFGAQSGAARTSHYAVEAADAGVTDRAGARIGSSWNEKSQQQLNSSLIGSDDIWYHAAGKLVKFRNWDEGVEWAAIVTKCLGSIAFDAVLCRGPRHDESLMGQDEWLLPKIATVALGAGCAKCGSCPEGPARYGVSPTEQLPLLEPPPIRSSAIGQAQKPHLLDPSNKSYPSLYVRCEDCLRARWCERCGKWWCEACYTEKGRRFQEVSQSASSASTRVHMGLCTEKCLPVELMQMEVWG